MNLYNAANPSLLTDFYELTMMQGYHVYNKNPKVVFDMFFRQNPFQGGFCIFAGLEPLIKAVLDFRFDAGDIEYLASLGIFRQEFLKFLSGFRFSGDVYSVDEGEVVFAKEPLIRVHASIIEAQVLESLLLNIVNFQTLIATKSARMCEAAKGRTIIEFGLRRAQGVDGALSASRAAYIGGAGATSNLLAGKLFNIPVRGTMAHSWVMAFDEELDSFRKFAGLYPNNTTVLVDTYNTLKSGIPNAVKVFKCLKKAGIKNFGIRLDSGDLEYLSKQARRMLDAAGLKEAKIVASNELDEYIIEQLIKENSPIDYFGVGTHLVTGKGDPALSGVYKLVARRNKKEYIPSMKVSNDPGKMTNPHIKNVLRVYGRDGLMSGDLVFLENERISLEKNARKGGALIFHHPDYNFESVKISVYGRTRVLLKKVVQNGALNYEFPPLEEIRNKTRKNLKALHPSFKRLLNPHVYKISITGKLMSLKSRMLKRYVWK
jgi:nicotinate phosphoribosyltransferase